MFPWKYWRGYLASIIFVLISSALDSFASANEKLVDMIYPYISKSLVSSLAEWSSGASFCVWNVIVMVLVVLLLVSIIMAFLLRWNVIQLGGWVLACITCLSLFNYVLFGMNEHAGALADDIRLDVVEYNITELNEATVYFRDQAQALSEKIPRDGKGNPKYASFDKLAVQAGEGFRVLTYEEAISVFSGSTAPVKKKDLSGGTLSKTLPLTGECLVDPDAPDVAMPFIMCAEMARRMSIYQKEDAKFAAFLACQANPDEQFQYTAYCMAYYLCRDALSKNPTSTAKTCLKELDAGTSKQLLNDLRLCQATYGDISGSSKSPDAADLLTSWYVQKFITPLHVEEEKPFDPLDSTQVDIEYQAPTPTPLPEKKED